MSGIHEHQQREGETMSDDDKSIPTSRERDEEFLRRMAEAGGGVLERDALGILKLVHPVTPRAE
jgi:hypothetical protein